MKEEKLVKREVREEIGKVNERRNTVVFKICCYQEANLGPTSGAPVSSVFYR